MGGCCAKGKGNESLPRPPNNGNVSSNRADTPISYRPVKDQYTKLFGFKGPGGINLGRCWNKYLIIEIFFYAAEDDARKEAEDVLWVCSRGHKQFLAKNLDWYPHIINWKSVSGSLKGQSGQLESIKQAKFLFDNIRIVGKREVTKVTRIFTASQDGWKPEEFHRLCNGMGPTLCLIRSRENYLAAGFTSISWSDFAWSGVKDSSAMVFALTNEMHVFKTNNPEKAVIHLSRQGPYF